MKDNVTGKNRSDKTCLLIFIDRDVIRQEQKLHLRI